MSWHTKRASSCRVFYQETIPEKENLHGRFRRLPDRACADATDPRRALGESFMSAEIIQFVPRQRRDHRPLDISHLFRSRPHENDLVMDHADTAPCEVWPTRTQGDDESA
jgi:hypothetical protein